MRVAGEAFSGLMSNISNEGMEVRCRQRVEINDEVSIHVITPDNEQFNYLSVVRWWRPDIGRKMGRGKFRYGLKFLAVDPEHAKLIEMVKYDHARRKENRRFEVEVPVRLELDIEGNESVTENLSKEGAFIRLDELPPPYRDDKLLISLKIPSEEEAIHTKAHVIHLLQPSWAEKLGVNPGVGLRFLDLPEEALRKIEAYLEKEGEKATGENEETSQ